MLRLLIVTENRTYRDALVLAMSSGTVTVIGAVATPEEALPLIKEGSPDVILLGVPGENGRAALRTFLLMDRDTRVVPMGVPAEQLELVAWAEAGAAGFVLRDSSLAELRLVVEAAARGEVYCSPAVTARFVQRLRARAAELGLRSSAVAGPRIPLTEREREIVFHIDQGCSNKEIARRLGIELATVKNHVHHILEKLNARRRSEAAARVAGRLRSS
jgi:two-component system, NarL family, nitrate/nitrite response regulator NarL